MPSPLPFWIQSYSYQTFATKVNKAIHNGFKVLYLTSTVTWFRTLYQAQVIYVEPPIPCPPCPPCPVPDLSSMAINIGPVRNRSLPAVSMQILVGVPRLRPL